MPLCLPERLTEELQQAFITRDQRFPLFLRQWVGIERGLDLVAQLMTKRDVVHGAAEYYSCVAAHQSNLGCIGYGDGVRR